MYLYICLYAYIHTYTPMNVLKSLVERFCGKVLLIIYMEIHDSGYWTKEHPRENMSGYRQVLAAPIKSLLLLLLCYTRIVPVRKDRLSELSSSLTKKKPQQTNKQKTFSNSFQYFLCQFLLPSSCVSCIRQSSLVLCM